MGSRKGSGDLQNMVTMVYPKPKKIIVEDFTGGFDDIIGAVLREDQERDHDQFRQLAESLRGKNDRETFRNIWSFVRSKIRYREDQGPEKIKSPARLLNSKVGDCKSMALLSAALVKNLGYPYFFRVTRYNPQTPENGHIYLMAIGKGGAVAIDPVNKVFSNEPKWWRKMDTRIQRLRGFSRVGQIPQNIQVINTTPTVYHPATGGNVTPPVPVVDQNKAGVGNCCAILLLLFLAHIQQGH